MEEFIVSNQQEILATTIALIVLLIFKFLGTKTVRKIGRISDLNQARTRLIIKYVNISLFTIGFGVFIFIWGVNFKEIGLLFSSIFAVIGVALFATWSILDSDFPEEADILDIRAFHLYLKKDNGELVTYPNNLMLQKGVAMIAKNSLSDDDGL